MKTEQRILNLLGLAMRAGKLTAGEQQVLTDIRKGQAKLVFIAADASSNTKKKFLDKCRYYEVPIAIKFTKEELSHAIGKQRTICAVTDEGFSGRFQELLEINGG